MTHGNVDSPEKQPGISFMPVLGRHGSMATYSPGNGGQLDDLSLPTSYLKVALDSVGIQNEGDLRQHILPGPSHFSLSFGHAGHSPKKETDPSVKQESASSQLSHRGACLSSQNHSSRMKEYGTKYF